MWGGLLIVSKDESITDYGIQGDALCTPYRITIGNIKLLSKSSAIYIVIQCTFIFQVYEHVDEAGNCVRCERIQGISEFVQNHQQYAMIKHHLNRYM